MASNSAGALTGGAGGVSLAAYAQTLDEPYRTGIAIPIPRRGGADVSLEYEREVYRSHLMDLLGVNDINEGKFTVIKGDKIRGPFDTYEEALDFAYSRHGVTPFLVKKIERNESVFYFSRGI